MNPFAAFLSQGQHRDAANWLVREHSREVLGMCRAMLRDPHAAEDATQDAFSRAFASLAAYRAEASPRTWLLRIAKNRCIDEIRRRQVQPWRIADDGEIDDAPALMSADVAQWLTDRESVGAALAALEGGDRALVVLRYRHGMSFAELADAFGLREGTARMRVTRALKRMRTAVEAQLPPDSEEPATERRPPMMGMPAPAPAPPAARSRSIGAGPPGLPPPGFAPSGFGGGGSAGAPPAPQAPSRPAVTSAWDEHAPNPLAFADPQLSETLATRLQELSNALPG